VSEADLLLAGDLSVEHDWLRDAPWPHLRWTVASLGYRPAPGGVVSVPIYPPGLPLLFAGAKWLFGQCGIIAVIAAMAGLLVAATYGIGRRVASPQVGAAAAWIVATCPVVLFMVASPMSDVPAAAMSTLAILGCLRPSRSSAYLAGLSMALVVLIRPNLAPLAASMGLWLLVMDRQLPTWTERAIRCALFGAGAAPGAAGMALFNYSLYGAVTASGYGDIDGFFAASHIIPNIRNYTTWLLQSQTPLVALGLAALAVPTRWLSKAHHVTPASLLLVVAATMTAVHLPYLVFDQWWYLRFFLPAWPALAIGTAWLCTNTTGCAYGRTGLLLLMMVGGWGLHFGQSHDAFRVGWGDLRYVSAAHVVRDVTRPGSVILAMQHSGTVSYYDGRRSLRFDWIEPRWLDEVVRRLKQRDHDVYILLEEWEIEGFRARFRGTPLGALAEDSLIFRQDVGTRVFLFDTRSHAGEWPRTETAFVPSAGRCCEPSR